MSSGLVVIEKTLAGKVWVNTWGVATASGTAGRFNDNADIEEVMGALVPLGPDLDTQTNPNDPGYVNAAVGASLIAAIIGFERLMHYQAVTFTKLYISDGKTKGRGIPGPSGVFASIPLGFAGLQPNPGEGIAPGTTVPQVNRSPIAFSQRNGLWLPRATLPRGDIIFGSEDGDTWASTAARAAYQARIDANADSSALSQAFQPPGGDAFTGVSVTIPNYAPKGATNEGQILGSDPISRLVVGDIISRQAKRGRRRSP